MACVTLQEDMHHIIKILPKTRQTMLFSATQVRDNSLQKTSLWMM